MWECKICKQHLDDRDSSCGYCGSPRGSEIVKKEKVQKAIKVNEFLWEKKKKKMGVGERIVAGLGAVIIGLVVKEYCHKPKYTKEMTKMRSTIETNFEKMTIEQANEYNDLREQVIEIYLKHLDAQDKITYRSYLKISPERNLTYEEAEEMTKITNTVRSRASPQELEILVRFENLIYKLAGKK